MILLTKARRQDSQALGLLFYSAVHEGARAYTVPQRHTWMPRPPKGKRWADRLAQMDVFVARRYQGLVGFVAVKPDGYVDFAFVAAQAQGRGLFSKLMAPVMAQFEGRTLSTHASLHAEPAFASLGFSVRFHETVLHRGQRLRRAYMERAAA